MAAQASPCGPDPPRIPAEPLDLLRRLNATPNVHPEPRPASPRSPVPPPARISPSAVSSHPTPSRRSPSQPDRPRASPRSAPDCHDALSQPDRPPNGAARPRPRWDPSSSPSTWTPGPSAPDRGGGRPGLLYPPTKGYDGPHPRSRWGPPPSGAADAVHNPTASMRASGCGQRAVDNLGRGDPPLRTVFHRLVDPCGNWGSTTVSFVHTCGHRCGELWITLSTALSTTGDNRAVSALETSRARPRYPLRRGRP